MVSASSTRTGIWGRCLIWIGILLVSMSLTPCISAYVVPLGIQGRVMYLTDPQRPVPSSVMFSVNDTASGFFQAGHVGKKGDDGIYSVSVKGNQGDLVEIRAWNDFHDTSILITLEGSMKGVDLLLDMTYPQMPPRIISIPVTGAIEGERYSYAVDADDPNGDIMFYGLVGGPEDMDFDGNVLVWLPDEGDAGYHDVEISVSDGQQAVSQHFTIVVEGIDNPPVIVSGPMVTAAVGSQYAYQVLADDADSLALQYSLILAPEGMQITSSGLVTWLPPAQGIYPVGIEVTDGTGSASQWFNITVSTVVNTKPRITSQPEKKAHPSELYLYDVDASDREGDMITYSLLDGPSGMEIDSISGMISWQTSSESVGWHRVGVAASDGRAADTQYYFVKVRPLNIDWKRIYEDPKAKFDLFRKDGDYFLFKQNFILKEFQGRKTTVIDDDSIPVISVTQDSASSFAIISHRGRTEDFNILWEGYPYSYFRVYSDESMEGIEAVIRVEKSWMEGHAGTQPIRVYRYIGLEWHEVPTIAQGEDEMYSYYLAHLGDQGEFAIAQAIDAQAYQERSADEAVSSARSLSVPFIIHGKVTYKGGAPASGIRITASDASGNLTRSAISGDGSNAGNYFLLIEGKIGDIIDITMHDGDRPKTRQVKIEGSRTKADFALDRGQGLLSAFATYGLGGKRGDATRAFLLLLPMFIFIGILAFGVKHGRR